MKIEQSNCAKDDLYHELKAHGFYLARNNGHRVYKDGHGHTFVTSNSPSDTNWAKAALRQLRKLLSLKGV